MKVAVNEKKRSISIKLRDDRSMPKGFTELLKSLLTGLGGFIDLNQIEYLKQTD